MAKALTVRAIETLKPGETRREIPDGLLPGLYLICQPSGLMSWAARFRYNGKPAKYTIGKYPAIDLATARELARSVLRAVAEGRNPAGERKQSRAAEAKTDDSVEAAIEEFLERYRQAKRQRTAEETTRLLRLHVLPRWKGRKLSDITKKDVLAILDRLIDAGSPVAANRCFAAVRLLFNWFAARDRISVSPCAGLARPTEETSRDRVLSDTELRAVWHSCETLGHPFGPMVQMLILTGQRRDECARAEWREIDLKARLWTIPRQRAKKDREHLVPLSEAAMTVLTALPRIRECQYVFSTSGKTAASNYAKNKRKLDALLSPDTAPWVLHDLRRSMATGMARLGINQTVVEKILNHSGSLAGVAGIYQRYDFHTEKREALERWGRHVEGLYLLS